MRPVIVAGCRTPFARAGHALRDHDPLALGLHALAGLLEAVPGQAALVDAVRWGIVVLDPRVPHMAREVVLRGALADTARAVTLTDNCITGATAVVDLVRVIAERRSQVAVAGGVESMSNPALQFSPRAARRFLDLARARGAGARLRAALRLRPRDFLPDPPSVTEPSTGLSMGEHCERMVRQWGIAREDQDALALQSHRRAAGAQEDGWLSGEIHPIGAVTRDTLVRADTSAASLSALPPVFDRGPGGTLTAGNSSPLTDGGAALMLMSQARAQRDGVEPLARVVDWEFAAIAPEEGLLMAPAVAVPRLLRRHGIGLDEVDLVEVHEAFAGQVLCNLEAWAQGWREPAVGRLEPERLNARGGSLALGHPFAATGIRLLTSLARQLHAAGARRGLASICGAGGTAAAVLLEAP